MQEEMKSTDLLNGDRIYHKVILPPYYIRTSLNFPTQFIGDLYLVRLKGDSYVNQCPEFKL